jgi:hypothetical protein
MEFINLTFADMIKCCKDRSIVEYKNREIALSDGLYAGMRKEWFNGTNQVLIKQKDNDNHWSNSFAICCPKDTKSFEKLVEGEKLTYGPGDSMFIPAGAKHSMKNTGPGVLKMVATFGPSRKAMR